MDIITPRSPGPPSQPHELAAGRLLSRVSFGFLGVLLVLALGALPALSDPRLPGPGEQVRADRFRAVDEYLQEQVARLGVPGAQLAVVDDGVLVHLSAFGVADETGRKMTPQTPVLLASVSKSLTAVAVMQQVESGRLDLAQPVTTYLAWFRTADVSRSAGITVGHLLSHTSGFSERDGNASQATDDRRREALEEGVRDLARATLAGDPGNAFTYSNINYDVLGLLVQTVSGEDFAQYMVRHVFAPLQMSNSFATASDAAAHQAASGFYAWFGSVWRPADVPVPTASMPSATMYSSAEDISHLLIALLSEGRFEGSSVLAPESASALLTPTIRSDDFTSYAMGWSARPLWEVLAPEKPQDKSYALPLILEHTGSWATTQTFQALVPKEALGVVLLVNGASPTTPSLARAMDSNVLRILHGLDPIPATIREEPLQQYGWAAALIVLLAELASLVLCCRILYGWVSGTKPASRKRLAAVFFLPLFLDAAVLWVALAYVPEHFRSDLPVIIRTVPDAGLFLVPALALAIGWGLLRTLVVPALWYRAAGRKRMQRA